MTTAIAPISCAIFTHNEEINLPKCLKSLSWCDDVVVVDSFSTDRTLEIANAHGSRVFQHRFSGFGDQRNWALETIPFKYEWILILDADEEVPPELQREMKEKVLSASSEVAAFRIKRQFFLWGKWLKYSSLYPTWVIRLIRKDRVRYVNRGHAETQTVSGRIEGFHHDLKDENLKGLHAWFERQNQYATQEADHELSQPRISLISVLSVDPLKRRESLKSLSRRVPFRAWLFFLYNYFCRLGFLDGMAGLQFSRMKAVYLQMLELKKYEMKKLKE